MGHYCCEDMKNADKAEVIDYCEPDFLTTIDTKDTAWGIFYCPFCGKKLKGTPKAEKIMKKALKEINEGKYETGTIEDLKRRTSSERNQSVEDVGK